MRLWEGGSAHSDPRSHLVHATEVTVSIALIEMLYKY